MERDLTFVFILVGDDFASQLSFDFCLEDKLNSLLERLDLANTLKNSGFFFLILVYLALNSIKSNFFSGSRHKWARHLKEEIAVIRRRILSLVNSTRQIKSSPVKPAKILKNKRKTTQLVSYNVHDCWRVN